MSGGPGGEAIASDGAPVLVIGATGFVGGRIVSALQQDGVGVRCLVRSPARAQGITGVEILQGDMLDAAAVAQAVAGVAAVVVAVHTLSPQPADGARGGYMDVEAAGIRNIVAACLAQGVRRVVYITSIGVERDAPSSWLRGRWATEQVLLTSGLDATVLRPGMVVGRGGDGFSLVAGGATRRVAVAVGDPRSRFRTVAVGDLAQDAVDLLQQPSSFGRALDVGSDDILTMRQMAAIAARSIGRRPGRMVFVPAAAVRLLAPLVERVARIPGGALGGLVGDGPLQHMIGDPAELRAILGRKDRPFLDAIEGQIIPARTRRAPGGARG